VNNKLIKSLLESADFYLDPAGMGKADVELYINPPYSDIEKTKRADNRGWILPNGDLYIEGDVLDTETGDSLSQAVVTDEKFFLTHKEIYLFLMRQNKVEHHYGQTMMRDIADSVTNGIAVIRVGKTNELKLSESYSDKRKEDYKETFKKYINNFKAKNLTWKLG
jgi:phosphoribosylformylglycinamidine (FGAM) synthase PurS component